MVKKQKPTTLLSVIVPVYNVVLYLDVCLESVLDQGLDTSEFEVLLVNDGSTDGSELIAQKWSDNYPNFRLISRPNGGLSAARNTGVEHAGGEYIVFLDSDDIVPPGAYRRMLDTLLESGSDFLTGGVRRFSRNHKIWLFNRTLDLFQESQTGLNIKTNPEYIRDTTPWNKMYKRDFFIKTGVHFPEGRIYEDVATTPKLYWAARSFDVDKEPVYFWRINDTGSITNTLNPVKATDRIWAIEQILSFIAEKDMPQEIRDEYDFTIVDYNLRWVFLDLWKYEPKARHKIIKLCHNLLSHIEPHIIERVPQPIRDWAFMAKKGELNELYAILQHRQRVLDEPLIKRSVMIKPGYTFIRYRQAVSIRIKRFLLIIARRLKKSVLYFIIRPVIQMLPVDEKLAVFSSYWGREFLASNGPPALCLELLHQRSDYKIVVFASKQTYESVVSSVSSLIGDGGSVKVVKNNTLAFYYNFWRAKYLFNDVNFQVGINFRGKYLYAQTRPGQIEVQTTHGIPLKKMGLDSDQAVQPKDRAAFIAKNQRYTYLVSSSAKIAKLFADSHGVNPKILKTGLPQNDFLFKKYSKTHLNNIKRRYNIPLNKKILVYTPTFRYGKGYAFRYLADFRRIQVELGNKYHIVIKLHPFNHTNLNMIDFADLTNFKNGKLKQNEASIQLFGDVRCAPDFYEAFKMTPEEVNDVKKSFNLPADINELMLISDVLITDYSSIMFNYIHLNKPMIFFTPDIEFYNNTRGSYFNIDEIAPGAVAKTNDELLEAVTSTGNFQEWEKTYNDKLSVFKSDFVAWEKGKAAEKILRSIGILD